MWSVRMEQELKDENAADKITPIDILVIGLNPAIWRGTSIQLLDAYYTQISWMNKIMDDFPDIKLVYKHHPNFKGDKKEAELLKNKKFETIIDLELNNEQDLIIDPILLGSVT